MFHSVVSTLRSVTDRREAGQGLVEYGLIIALVAVVAIAALVLLGGNIIGALGSAAASI